MIFIFLDGVGLGEESDFNPFWLAKSDYLPLFSKEPKLPDKTPIKPIDANLGVKGIPQSATGQTTIYTGENIPKILGKHIGSFPNKLMRSIIKKKNIFTKLKKINKNPVFLNAYPKHSELFSKPNIDIKDNGDFSFSSDFPKKYKRRISVTTTMMIVNGFKPFDIEDIENNKSIYQEYTNKSLLKFGLKLPIFTPETAAEIIYETSKKYDFLLYEYFQTDLYGHRKSIDECVDLIKNLNRLIKKLISLMNKNEDTLIITCDHGNLENKATKSHTNNPVPLIAWGKGSDFLRDNIENLSDISLAIIDYYKNN